MNMPQGIVSAGSDRVVNGEMLRFPSKTIPVGEEILSDASIREQRVIVIHPNQVLLKAVRNRCQNIPSTGDAREIDGWGKLKRLGRNERTTEDKNPKKEQREFEVLHRPPYDLVRR